MEREVESFSQSGNVSPVGRGHRPYRRLKQLGEGGYERGLDGGTNKGSDAKSGSH
jgi:hypothetical protein